MTQEEQFYSQIESGVRRWVRLLRNAGINTECSCGHEGYIQCQSTDPQTEIERIKGALHEHGLWEYSIEFLYQSWEKAFAGWSQSITVRSKLFKANLIGVDINDAETLADAGAETPGPDSPGD